jgi:hypothetical protein
LLEAVSLMVRGKMYLQHDGAPHITLGMWDCIYMNLSLTAG